MDKTGTDPGAGLPDLLCTLRQTPLDLAANAHALLRIRSLDAGQMAAAFGDWAAAVTGRAAWDGATLEEWGDAMRPAAQQSGLIYRIFTVLAMIRWHLGDHAGAIDSLDHCVQPLADQAPPPDAPPPQTEAEYADYAYDAVKLHHDTVQDFMAFARPFLSDGGLSIIDAACGSGLAAPFLAPHASRLVGIDLSASMIERAFDGGHYDQLIEADMIASMARMTQQADRVVCIGATYYLRDLAPFLHAAWSALRPGGVLLLTDYHAPRRLGCGITVGGVNRHARNRQTMLELAAQSGDGDQPGLIPAAMGMGLVYNIPSPYWALRRPD